MKLCNDCLWSIETHPAEWQCLHPLVNRLRPSFLAGNPRAAATTYSERANVIGVCGPKGRLWTARDPHGPPAPGQEGSGWST